jgi:hypothetical protein
VSNVAAEDGFQAAVPFALLVLLGCLLGRGPGKAANTQPSPSPALPAVASAILPSEPWLPDDSLVGPPKLFDWVVRKGGTSDSPQQSQGFLRLPEAFPETMLRLRVPPGPLLGS